MAVGKQILMVEVFTFDEDADPPAEWNWSEMVGDPVRILGAGPFADATEEEVNDLGYDPGS